MDIGQCDFCLRVGNVTISRIFYEGLGFRQVEGVDEEGWGVLVNGQTRLGIFEAQYMESAFTLNFRGGDIGRISAELSAKGYVFEKGPKLLEGGGGSASLRDPDGNVIFFDTAPSEMGVHLPP